MADSYNQQERIKETERIERVRQAVIRRQGNVTVGDIITETGFAPDVAEQSLRSLISTHEGTMRVSDKGEIMYAFTPNCIARDFRSWWERSKDTIYKGFKSFMKIMIMLIMVVYFIIYVVILLALLFSDRNNNNRSSHVDFGWMIYVFWGRDTGSSRRNFTEKQKKTEPLYTRTYKFIFGPEEKKEDPMQLQKDFAQLVRSKDGVITAEDWMVASGHMLPQCESEIARYTAIYDGEAQICDDGTLVYVFKDIMKSMDKKVRTKAPKPAWERLEEKRPLTGNSSNVAVILMNVFNLVMALLFVFAGASIMATINGGDGGATAQQIAEAQALAESGVFTWLGTIPLLFSLFVFAGPLVRLPKNIKENARRRKDNIRKVVLENVDNARTGATVMGAAALKNVNHGLRKTNFDQTNVEEINQVLDTVAVDMNAEVAESGGYRFDDLKRHTEKAFEVREALRLGNQDLGRVIFSTDNEDEEANRNAYDDEIACFDRELNYSPAQSTMQSMMSQSRGEYDTDYRAKRQEKASQSQSLRHE